MSLRWWIPGLLVVAASGCARGPNEVETPGAPSAPGVNRLTVLWKMDAAVNDSYYYFVAFDSDGNQATGPLPVISSPWGNGWGTGTFNLFVEYHGGVYGVYTHAVNPDGTPNDTFVNRPFSSIPPAGSNQMQFTLDMDSYFGADLRQLEVNFITTNELILDPNISIRKIYDALGPTGNDYVSIQTQSNVTFSNSDPLVSREVAGDVAGEFPAIDIVDWAITIERQ